MGGDFFFSFVALFLGSLWMIIYFFSQKLRREMLVMSVFSLFLLPLLPSFPELNDSASYGFYPLFSWTHILFLFSLSGIASVIFHVLFQNFYTNTSTKKSNRAESWLIHLFLFFFGLIWITILFVEIFHLSLSLSLLFSALLTVLYLTSHAKQTFLNSLLSGFFASLIVFFAIGLSYFLEQGITVLSFHTLETLYNQEMILWSFALGLIFGPIYEFIRRLEIN